MSRSVIREGQREGLCARSGLEPTGSVQRSQKADFSAIVATAMEHQGRLQEHCGPP
jgi:hypothetical protein